MQMARGNHGNESGDTKKPGIGTTSERGRGAVVNPEKAMRDIPANATMNKAASQRTWPDDATERLAGRSPSNIPKRR